jgi:hypothetical protein
MRRFAPILVIVLSGCAPTVVEETFTDVGEPLDTPSPSESAVTTPSGDAATPESAGTFTFVDVGGPVDGPGISVAEALDAPAGQEMIVNAIILQDRNGDLWMCDSLAEGSPPACGEPALRVDGYPGGLEFDPETAELLGMHEEDGVIWIEAANTQNYGTVQLGSE